MQQVSTNQMIKGRRGRRADFSPFSLSITTLISAPPLCTVNAPSHFPPPAGSAATISPVGGKRPLAQGAPAEAPAVEGDDQAEGGGGAMGENLEQPSQQPPAIFLDCSQQSARNDQK
jgi:hypothetical protein